MTTRVLATDLDGTLIPLEGHPQNVADLQTLTKLLKDTDITLVFVTGRHLDAIKNLIAQHALPRPDWVIGDVGTSLYRSSDNGNFEAFDDYQKHQAEITSALPIGELRGALEGIKGLVPQEDEKQGQFKLSYYTAPEDLEPLADRLKEFIEVNSAPYSLIQSIDPFTKGGLIDFLPKSISKAYALDWWHDLENRDKEETLFAGDAGNDLAALVGGYRSIIVGNADDKLVDAVQSAHNRAGWHGRLHKAEGLATSGVLEGCRQFGLFDGDPHLHPNG